MKRACKSLNIAHRGIKILTLNRILKLPRVPSGLWKDNYFQIKHILFILLLTAAHSAAQAQYITTIAGNGTIGFSGDGGPAILAEFNRSQGIATDSAGNVYVADYDNYRIRKISTSGIINTIAGNGTFSVASGDGGPATAASIDAHSVAVDKYGNIYFDDDFHLSIRKLSVATGIITTIAGTGISGYSGNGGPATAAEMTGANFICLDTTGNIYLSDDTGTVVCKINAVTGIISVIAGNGTLGYSGDGGPATAATLNGGNWLAIDKIGDIYITDVANYRIRKVDTTGIITTIAGTGTSGYSGDGGPATAANIAALDGICVDKNNNIYMSLLGYVGTSLMCYIRKIDTAGVITTIAGGAAGFSGDGGLAVNAELTDPYGIAAGNGGNLYIVDAFNYRVREITTHPYFTNGAEQLGASCGSVYNIDTLLAAVDTNAGNIEVWSLLAGPYHGVAVVADTMLSTGGLLIPSGLSYTPTTGFTGTDTMQVGINDGLIADTTVIFITVPAPLTAGAIYGTDSVCSSDSILLADTVAGGIWAAGNSYAAISATGMLHGLAPGTDTIYYTVSREAVCPAVAAASFTVTVQACTTGVPAIAGGQGLSIYPNPVQDILHIAAGTGGSYRLLSEAGVVMLQGTIAQGNTDIAVGNLPAGAYLAELTDEAGAKQVALVVKE